MDLERMSVEQRDALCKPKKGLVEGVFVDEESGKNYFRYYDGENWIACYTKSNKEK